MVPLQAIPVAILGMALLAVTVWRPTRGCAIMLLAVPLTAGLGRNTLLPVLRPSEAIVLTVAAGALLSALPDRRKRGRPASSVDILLGAYTAAACLVPASLLILNHADIGFEAVRNLLGPVEAFLLYLVFSHVRFEGRDLRVALNLALIASVVVAFVGLAQDANVPGVRSFLATYYPGDGEAALVCSGAVCRPSSLLEHFSAFGGLSALNYGLALVLLTLRYPGFRTWWLATVCAIDLVAAIASLTQAVIIGVVVITAIVLWRERHLPKQLMFASFALLLGLAVLWPAINARIAEQLAGPSASLISPDSLQTRTLYWNQFFIPLFREHPWLGVGGVIPTEVPASLTSFVDNEYLSIGLQSGLIGLLLFVLMLAGVGALAYHASRSDTLALRSLGLVVLTYVPSLAIMGLTSEYFSFGGVAQQFWAMTGLVVGAWVWHSQESLISNVRSVLSFVPAVKAT